MDDIETDVPRVTIWPDDIQIAGGLRELLNEWNTDPDDVEYSPFQSHL
jgi:hypothetical protein